MRILHIDLGRELRGGQHQVILLLKTLHADGYACTLLATPGSPLFQAASKLGVSVQAASLCSLRRLSSDYDLVHAHDARSHTWAALASGEPFVVSRRVAFAISKSPLSKLKYRRAARFLAVSKFVAQKLSEAGVPSSKIDIVFDALQVSEHLPARTPQGPVIALAMRDPLKGRDLIERASQMARIPIAFSSDLPNDLLHASAFVYVSRSEGFGSAALLAMNAGVPLIASHVDGLAEVFEDGVSGIAVANDPASIAAALTRLRSDQQLADALVTNAHHRLRTLFNTSTLLANTLASYRRALAR